MTANRHDWTLTAVPLDPAFVPADAALVQALSLFEQLVPASEHRVERAAVPRFHGAELLASEAACAVCGSNVVREGAAGSAGRRWFADIDARASRGVAADTPVTLPACGHTMPLAAIAFNEPTGAARCALVARFEVWDDDWFEGADGPWVDALAALSQAFGAPLRFVRTYLSLLPADRRLFERLVSADEAERVDAAVALRALELGHFEDHAIANLFVEDHAEALTAACRSTTDAEVRRQIFSVLGMANFCSPALREIVETELSGPGEALELALYVCQQAPRALGASLAPLVRRHHAHTDRRIRWRCALALKTLQARDEEDRVVIRRLALDPDYAVRMEAVFAMQAWVRQAGGAIDAIDRAVLERLVASQPPGDTAAHYARAMLG